MFMKYNWGKFSKIVYELDIKLSFNIAKSASFCILGSLVDFSVAKRNQGTNSPFIRWVKRTLCSTWSYWFILANLYAQHDATSWTWIKLLEHYSFSNYYTLWVYYTGSGLRFQFLSWSFASIFWVILFVPTVLYDHHYNYSIQNWCSILRHFWKLAENSV